MNFLVILMTKIVNHICFMLFSLKLISCIFIFQGLIDFTCLENERQVQETKGEEDVSHASEASLTENLDLAINYCSLKRGGATKMCL